MNCTKHRKRWDFLYAIAGNCLLIWVLNVNFDSVSTSLQIESLSYDWLESEFIQLHAAVLNLNEQIIYQLWRHPKAADLLSAAAKIPTLTILKKY